MIRHRDGRVISAPTGQDRFLARLYGSALGRALLRPLTSPALSRAGGWLLSRGISRLLIAPFIRSNHIDMSQYEPGPFRSYNEFFSRRILPHMRPIDEDARHFIAPCDSKLTVLPISREGVLHLKHTPYTASSLLRDEALARRFEGGWALIFRLTVDDYHRYCYPVTGTKGANTRIPGVLHTVNPVANDHYPIYKENSREYCLMHSEVFGDLAMMEVGALMVGRIVNHHGAGPVRRGEEKGYFQFGGSTVVLLVPPGKLRVDEDILANSRQETETVVRMGEKIGTAL